MNSQHVNFEYGDTLYWDGKSYDSEHENTWSMFETAPKGIRDPRLENSVEITDPEEALIFTRRALSAIFGALVPGTGNHIDNAITYAEGDTVRVWWP